MGRGTWVMAIIECEIIPRPDATPEQYRQLGGALAQWSRRESGDDGILHFLSRFVLADLTNGKPPSTFLSQYENMLDESRQLYTNPKPLTYEEQLQRSSKLRDDLGEERALRRIVYFQVLGGAYANRKMVIDSLRQDIPPELVFDVMVDHRSWELES